ncbi:MAG: type II secretion system secretin GspD, partial [Candidatus Deferrimicrobiaceae bacterium]
MSEQTKKNFIFDERVQGKITIISPRRVTLAEAYDVFLSVLQVKGFTTVEKGNTIKIILAREARQETIPTGSGHGRLPGAEFITRIVPLQYVEGSEVVPLLTPLVSKDGMVSTFASSNSLLMIDSRSNIDRLLKILGEIDTEGSPGGLRVFPLSYAAPADITKMLEAIYHEGAGGAPGAKTRGKRFAGTRSSAIKFLPDTRTNSVIVLGPPEMLADVAGLIAKIDIPSPTSGGKINVYYLENADAEEVAKVLASLSEKRPGAAPTPAPGARVAQPTVAGVLSAELEGGVKVTPDKATNSLVIVASPNDFQTLTEVIKKLDIRRRQVFVEAAIMEIDLDKALDVGVEWRGAAEAGGGQNGAILGGTNFDFQGNINSLFASLATGTPLIFSGTGLIGAGIGGSVTLPDGTKIPAIAAVLRAAQTRSNLNILSSPHLLTQNNKEAEIIVGENVPFITSTSRDTTNLANVINTVERKDVGITLRITPHIHESEFVSLDIYQESSALKDTSLLQTSTVGPTTTKRSAKTTVLVKSGDTVIIGGMMQETTLKSESKIPLLGDIPLLGYLFKFYSSSKKKTNLVILLTPHIIQEPGVASKSLEGRQRTILDAFDPKRDEVKRALPGARGETQP